MDSSEQQKHVISAAALKGSSFKATEETSWPELTRWSSFKKEEDDVPLVYSSGRLRGEGDGGNDDEGDGCVACVFLCEYVFETDFSLAVLQIVNDPGDGLLSCGADVTSEVHEVEELFQHFCHDGEISFRQVSSHSSHIHLAPLA